MKAVVACLLVVALVATVQARSYGALQTSTSSELSVGSSIKSLIRNIMSTVDCIYLTLEQGVLSMVEDVLVGCVSGSDLIESVSCIATTGVGLIEDVVHSLLTCNTH